MSVVADDLKMIENAPIPTWFGIGGAAARLASPENIEQLRRCLAIDRELRVLGDGANLLVDDGVVDGMVVTLGQGEFAQVERDPASGRTVAGAGANLPKLIVEAVRLGLGGVEGLGGIPASVGGAVMMNAGGAFGQIADVIHCVHALDRDGREIALQRSAIDFSYRHSGLGGLVVTRVELDLREQESAGLRNKLKEVMEYKKRSQPMAERSAGCTFKNPTLSKEIDGIGAAGQRVSAGLLIDRAGCKGLEVRGAKVSDRHANFFVTQPTAQASDVIELMARVTERVQQAFGVTLEPEVVVWKRSR